MRGIRLAEMDMWKPFRNVSARRAPQAAILYDTFHVMRHLNDVLDKARKAELDHLFLPGEENVVGHRLTEPSIFSSFRRLIFQFRGIPVDKSAGNPLFMRSWRVLQARLVPLGVKRQYPPQFQLIYTCSQTETHKAPSCLGQDYEIQSI